jgi:4-hydroxy-tetrahydrodipicolinate synthase
MKHFLTLAAEEIPVCMYEIAGRAASSIEVSTFAQLAKDSSPQAKYLVAIKDASANLQRALDTKRMCGDRFAMLSGDDGTFVSFLASGGVGVISVVSHLTPRSLMEILKSAKESKIARAADEQCRINPLVDAIFWESNPIPVKSLLHKLQKIKHPQFCEPLLPMSEDKLVKLVELAQKTGDLQ